MAKKFNDVVVYVRNGKEFNALVLTSQPFADGEHLTLVYTDGAAGSMMTGIQVDAAIKKEFGVPPLVEGALNGWTEVANPIAQREGYIEVSLNDLISLSGRITSHAPELEVCPNAVVPSAGTLIDSLAKERDELGKRADDAEAEAKKSADEIAGLQGVISEKSEQYAQLEKKYDDATQEVDALKAAAALAAQPSTTDISDLPQDKQDNVVEAALESIAAPEVVATEPPENPAPITDASIAGQNEHDRETGNVNEHGQTPAEAVAAESTDPAEDQPSDLSIRL